MNKVNYQKELEKILHRLEKDGRPPFQGTETAGIREGHSGTEENVTSGPCTLFLHSCCAPCSSYVLEYLSVYFQITVFYYNPNISFEEEYRKRVEEQKRLITSMNREGGRYPIAVTEGDYRPEEFYEMAKGMENCPEGGERCFRCFDLRLRETARRAVEAGSDYFATTLTISPLKNAQKLNETGMNLEREYGIAWLPSDFKKHGGYKRSVELSEQYGLYRQDYCGCAFSRAERERQKAEKGE